MDATQFAYRIKTERHNQKISQKRLAELIGIDNTALSRIETGKTDITVGVLSKIAKARNVPIEYLLLDFIPEDRGEFDVLWKHINKLDHRQKKMLIDIIIILTQNSERWSFGSRDDSATTEDNKVVNYAEIGQRIRSHRLQTQLSKEELAELAGISPSFLGSVERGEEILSIETLFKIANALRQPVSGLLLGANRNDQGLGLWDAVEELERSYDDKSAVLLNLLTLLIDNADKW